MLAAAAAAIAVAVGTTRVLLGVHWMTDVLAGSPSDGAWFAISSIAFGGRALDFGRPVQGRHRAEEAKSDRGRAVSQNGPGRVHPNE